MKKYNFLKTAVALSLIYLAPHVANAQEDFRGTEWGTGRAEVLKQHGKPVKQGNIKGMSGLVYEARAVKREALAIFYFLPDSLKLAAGEYAFAASYENPMRYVEDYNEVGDAVSDLYGTPSNDKTEWESEKDKLKYDKYGNAIEDGRLNLVQAWKTSEGVIIHKLSNAKPGGHTLLYASMEYAPIFFAILTTRKSEGL